MKFIHTADWHLGKIVHGIYMTEDQRYILNQFLRIVEEEKPDAIVIAGDLYDRSVPPTEAVNLLDEILFKMNIEMGIPIVAISGNHDSAERLSFGTSWYKHSQLFISGKMEEEIKPIHIKGVNFYCVPFAEPGVVKQITGNEHIVSHHTAMEAIIEGIMKNLDPSQPNVFVGHAFVAGGEVSDSERTLSVGGTGTVSRELFKPFTYTALGHLHSPDAINDPSIYYAGSILKYSFSESAQQKSVNIVTIEEDHTMNVKKVPLVPQYDMRELKGYFDELLDPAFYSSQKREDYLKVTLLDHGSIIDPIHKLRQVYPRVMHLERKWDLSDQKNKKSFTVKKDRNMSELQLFENFYEQMTDREFDEEKRKLVASVIEEVKREGDY
ncbi:exonuclease SbcCD subunit D [Bacillus testis]|uniref:exonuclease SbcCD subunit D n=1 Tax=Bacillus testis TaxID=1622072 RepID=UPI00067E67F3|nr:exonuclease SbcCD subunit D [Bacillus testis]